MPTFCEDDILPNCDTCKELTFTDCDNINISAGLVAGTEYYLFIIDKFNKYYRQTIIVNGNGSFDVDASVLPSGMLNAYAGKFEIFLSTTTTGEDYNVNLTIDSVVYNCVIATFNVEASNICCPNIVVSSDNVTILDQDGNTVDTVACGDTYTVEVLTQINDTIDSNTSTIIDPIV